MRAGKIIEFLKVIHCQRVLPAALSPAPSPLSWLGLRCIVPSWSPEDAILEAMKWARERDWTIEGSAGVALAAFFQQASRYEEKNVVVLFCGGNLSPEVQSRMP